MTAQLKANYIAGEWLAGSDVNRNINPSDTSDIVGEYARADEKQALQAIDSALEA
jgi:acyl-CoA reductase-like NAD-dependent aldehyde dehydrogenase